MIASVVGARGYLGRETVRLLLDHPEVEEVRPISRGAKGESFGTHVPSLAHRGLRMQGDEAVEDSDLVFLATPKGAAPGYVQMAEDNGAKHVIDLSRDHRIQALARKDDWVYGLADLDPVAKGQRRIANPGCYPTASLLAVLPAARAGLLAPGPVIVDGKSGVSGAGVSPRGDLHFPSMEGSTRAYKVVGHDHTEEIHDAVANGQAKGHPIRFTPHLVPQSRGLLSTVYAPLAEDVDQDRVDACYREAYADRPFVHVVDEPDTAPVRGSNLAHVAPTVDPATGLLTIRCAIDNLVKGGAGQAVQNLNDALGLDPTTGLRQTGGGI